MSFMLPRSLSVSKRFRKHTRIVGRSAYRIARQTLVGGSADPLPTSVIVVLGRPPEVAVSLARRKHYGRTGNEKRYGILTVSNH